MKCRIQCIQPPIEFEFCPKNHKQKILVDALLKYGNLDIAGLATILEVAPEILSAVHMGYSFLVGEQLDVLIQLFLVFFSD